MSQKHKPPKANAQRAKRVKDISESGLVSRKIPIAEGGQDKYWSFSFTYWRQIENFGLRNDVVNINWFVSFLEKLRDLSSKTIEQFSKSSGDRAAFRFHPINWNSRNIPISKDDLNWLPTEILNSNEIEFYQFQISTSLGRVIGYFDFDNVFNIVLLDPKHNAQPSKNYGYKVDPTGELTNEYQQLLKKHLFLKRSIEECSGNCSAFLKIKNENSSTSEDEIIFVDSDFNSEIREFCSRHELYKEDMYSFIFDAFEALQEKIGADIRNE